MREIFTKHYLCLLLIVLLSAFLRFYKVDLNPPSLTWDEVAWGYNAYSLGNDGRDEFGRFSPYDYLESFGDFKPPVYAYLDTIPIKIFGLNEFGVRFPSAFFGVLTVFLTYFLVIEIFFSSILKKKYALASSFLLSISPWHIILSRAAFEANIATFFLTCGVWAFLFGIRKNRKFLTLSAISFVLSMYTFNSARIVAPLLVLFLAFIFKRDLLIKKRYTLAAALIGLLIISPIVGFLFSKQASLRFKEVNIFSDLDVIKRVNQEVNNDGGIWWSKIIHNRRFTYGVEYVKHYFDNLNPRFLFITGDGNPKFSIQEVGQMYIWEAFFLVYGIFILLKSKEGKWWLVPLWLIIGIIPAATARETPHALRIEATLPTFQIFVAYGFVLFFHNLSKYKRIIFTLIGIVIVINLLYFLHDYFFHYPYIYSHEWQYGYKESIKFVNDIEKNFDQIWVTNELGRPYIYYLFYKKTDPRLFRINSKIYHDNFGFVHVENFGKYYFPIDLDSIQKSNSRILYVNKASDVPANAKILRRFYTLAGDNVLVAYTL